MAAALAHDIGHAPFGHTGEEALQKAVTCQKHREQFVHDFPQRLQSHKDLTEKGERDSECNPPDGCILPDGFEGNAQSFRILTLLGTNHPTSKNHGMNLTRRVLRASLKYPWRRGAEKHKTNKWGVYDSDIETYRWLIGGGDIKEPYRQNLESSIMDIADDIAYAVHDLEDFYKANAIPFSEIYVSEESTTFLKIMDYVRGESGSEGNAPPLLPSKQIDRLEREYRDFCEWRITEDGSREEPDDIWWLTEGEGKFPILAKLVSVLMILPSRRFEDSVQGRQELSYWRGNLISLLVDSVKVSGPGGQFVEFDEKMKPTVEFLKQLTWYFVIDDPDLAAIRLGQEELVIRCFRTLFNQSSAAWLKAPEKDLSGWLPIPSHKLRKRLPERLADYVELGRAQSESAKEDPRDGEYIYSPRQIVARAVVDFICSLTDEEMYSYSLQVGGSPTHSRPRSLA